MDCLNAQPSKAAEPGLLHRDGEYDRQSRKPRRGGRGTQIAFAVLGALFLILLALIIWLAVEMHRNRDDIRDLRNRLSEISGSATSTYVRTAGTASSSNSTLASVSTAYPAVYLSQNATAQNGYTYSGSLYRGSGYWAAQPSITPPRADFAAISVNEKLYIFGGHDGQDKYLMTGLSFDPLLNVTNATANMPVARSHFAAGSPDNRTIYVVGGYASETNESNNTPEKCSLAYDVAANSWSSGPCLVEARGSACGAVVAGKLFVAGGLGLNGTQLTTVELFHPANNSWTTFASLPSGRSDAGCAASGTNLVVAGGTNGSSDQAEVWAFDAFTAARSQLADLPTARFDLQLVGLPDGDVLAIGGGQHVNRTEVGTHLVERYTMRSNQWVEKAPLATQRFAFGAAYINEGAYALGGHVFCNDTASEDCGNRVLDSTEVFYDSDHPDVFIHIQQPGIPVSGAAPNASQVLLLTTTSAVNGYAATGSLYRGSGYWAVGQDMPQPLSDLNVVGSGNIAFIVGGLDIDTVDVSDQLFRYDPVVGQYTNLSALPEPRTRGGADILGDSLYYVAGFTDGSDTAEPVDTMLVYNMTANSWRFSAATLSSPRSDVCMAAVNGSLYVAGGYSANYTDTLNLAERYDPNTDTWTTINSMPTPRGDVMCAAMNGLFVVAGGFYDPTGNFTPASFRTEVQAYDPSTGEWTSLAPLPVARGDAAMTVVPSRFGDRLLVMGGESQVENQHTQVATHQVQEYSSALNEWILKAPMATSRFRHDCAYAEGRVLTFGGASSSLFADEGGMLVPMLRPIATVEQFFDTDNPDVFVYVAT